MKVKDSKLTFAQFMYFLYYNSIFEVAGQQFTANNSASQNLQPFLVHLAHFLYHNPMI